MQMKKTYLAIFFIGVTLLLAGLIAVNLSTQVISMDGNPSKQILSVGNDLILIEPDWKIENAGKMVRYSSTLFFNDRDEDLALYFPRASFMRIWINDIEYRNQVDEPAIISQFLSGSSGDQRIPIVLEIPTQSNEIQNAPLFYLGRQSVIEKASLREISLRVFIVGLSFALFIQALSLFFQKRSEKYLFSMAGFVYSTFGYTLLSTFPSLKGIQWLSPILFGPIRLPFISDILSQNIYQLVFPLLVAFLTYLVIKNFVPATIWNIEYIYYILPVTAILFFSLQSDHLLYLQLLYRNFINMLETIVILKGVYKNKNDRIYLMLGNGFTLAINLFMTGCGIGIIPHGNLDLLFKLGGVSASFYAVAFSIAINGKFAHKFIESEYLASQLNITNLHLQDLVSERTQKLSRAYERLENEQTQKDAFITNMMHTLKTPLFSLEGYAEMAKESLPADHGKALHYLAQINKNVEFIISIVNNLFLAIRLEYGKVGFMFEHVNMVMLIEKIRSTTMGIAEQKEIEVDYHLPDTPIFADCDLFYLSMAVQNIVDNAIRHSCLGGRIEIAVKQNANKIILTVQDNGEGILESDLPRIFDRYFSHTSDRISSSGLGLSISKDIITAHNGEIQVTSQPGTGSLFLITIPEHINTPGLD